MLKPQLQVPVLLCTVATLPFAGIWHFSMTGTVQLCAMLSCKVLSVHAAGPWTIHVHKPTDKTSFREPSNTHYSDDLGQPASRTFMYGRESINHLRSQPQIKASHSALLCARHPKSLRTAASASVAGNQYQKQICTAISQQNVLLLRTRSQNPKLYDAFRCTMGGFV